LDTNTVGITLDETTTIEDLQNLFEIFAGSNDLPFTTQDLASPSFLAPQLPCPRPYQQLSNPSCL
jgi:glycine dehydrogenase